MRRLLFVTALLSLVAETSFGATVPYSLFIGCNRSGMSFVDEFGNAETLSNASGTGYYVNTSDVRTGCQTFERPFDFAVSIPALTGYTPYICTLSSNVSSDSYPELSSFNTSRKQQCGASISVSTYRSSPKFIYGSVETPAILVWYEPNKYKVTFNPGEGTVSPSMTTVTYDDEYGNGTGGWPTPVRGGYSFLGWYTANDGGTKVEAENKVQITGDQMLYAKWSPKTYTITIDADGGIGGDASKTFTVTNDQQEIAFAMPSRTGYGAPAWAVSVSPTFGKPSAASGIITIPAGTYGDFTLKASWSAPIQYHVTIDGGGEIVYSYSTELQNIPFTPPERTGYGIESWEIGSGYSGAAPYVNGEYGNNLVIPAGTLGNFTITPRWQANVYRIGYVPDRSGYYQYLATNDVAFVVSPPPPTPKDHAFGGWTVQGAGDNAYYSVDNWATATKILTSDQCCGAGATAVAFSNLTEVADGVVRLVAVFNEITMYDVTATVEPVGAGAVNLSPDGGRYSDGTELTLSFAANAGYGFKCWQDTGTAENPRTVNVFGNANYLVICTGKVYTVSFDVNDPTASVEVDSKEVTFAEEFGALPLPSNSDPRRIFAGWYTQSEGGDPVTENTMLETAGPVALFAHWDTVTIPYSVVFFGNGGTNIVGRDVYTQAMEYGTAANLSAGAFTRKGFAFEGWVTDPVRGEIDYADRAEVENLTSVSNGIYRLFAKWKAPQATSEFSLALGCADLEIEKELSYCTWRTNGVNRGAIASAPLDGDSFAYSRIKAQTDGNGRIGFSYRFVTQDDSVSFRFRVANTDVLLVAGQSSEGWASFAYDVVGRQGLEWGISGSDNGISDPDSCYIELKDVRWESSTKQVDDIGVTFRRNDGTAAPADIVTNVTRKAGVAFGTLPVIYYGSETNLGWQTKSDGSGEAFTAASVVPSSAADGFMLYASWAQLWPEPTAADWPKVSAMTMGSGMLSLVYPVTNVFDYVLRYTDSLQPVDWKEFNPPKTSSPSETGDAVFEIPMDPAVPRRFFSIEPRRRAVN